MVDDPRVAQAVGAHVLVLYQADRFDAAADNGVHTVMNDLLGRGRDRHHARRALAVQRHAGHRVGQARADRGLATDIAAGRALLDGSADDHVFDQAWLDAGAFDGVLDGVAGKLLGLGVVEGAAEGFADWRAGGGDDDGFAHGILPDPD